MTKFTQKSFSVPVSSGGISDEELTRRWEAIFGKKPRKKADAESAEAEPEAPAKAAAGK